MTKKKKQQRPKPKPQEQSHHRRLHNWEAFDRIELKVEPRFKQSGLSGNQWRTSVVITFWFKGQMLHARPFRNMDAAIRYLGPALDELCEPISDQHVELDRSRCSQPGCSRLPSAGRVYPKRLTAPDGSLIDPKDVFGVYHRQFCADHAGRGDADREDNDKNYATKPPKKGRP